MISNTNTSLISILHDLTTTAVDVFFKYSVNTIMIQTLSKNIKLYILILPVSGHCPVKEIKEKEN